MIGLALDLPADQREEGTLATTVMGVMSGCGFVRVHDVKANYRAIKMTEAILRVHSATEQHSPADCFELPSIRQKRPVDVF